MFRALILTLLIVSSGILSACTTNPATGRQQFTGLMPPEAEQNIGAQEHQKVVKQMGLYPDEKLQAYVNEVGRKVARYTERSDVQYRFFIVDSDMVNAFALPGGYIYVTRGLLALANNEAELAAVLAHEIGHITGRHSAERYSRGLVTGLGAAVLGASLDNPDAARAINIGSDLYIKSYSREQESEADDLGIRYLHRAGYDPIAMAAFLQSLQRESTLQQRLTGKAAPPAFFSTHPNTANRVVEARQIAANYPKIEHPKVRRDSYLAQIDGLEYGNSAEAGFVRGSTFYHPQIGFKYTAPQGFEFINKPAEVISRGPNGAVIVFDFGDVKQNMDPLTYLNTVWMQGEQLQNPESITVNGMPAATAAFPGTVGGQPVTIRLVAIQWQPGRFARFQMAIPRGAPADLVTEFRRTTYSFQKLSEADKRTMKSEVIVIVTAGAGDTVSSMARRQPFDQYSEARFRILNGMAADERLEAGRQYKLVRQ